MTTWEEYARSCDRMAAYYESRGEAGSAQAARNKADTARRAAISLTMEKSTGLEHCACCLKPIRRAADKAKEVRR